MVATLTVPIVMTAAQFAELPDPVHGGKMELVRGRVVIMAPVGPDHGEKTIRGGRRLDEFAELHGLGVVRTETGYWLSAAPDNVRAPDISFVSKERLAQERVVDGFVAQAPDLAVEVTSPNDRESDIAEKVELYLASGVRRVWVLRPDRRTVTVHRPGGDSHTYAVGDSLLSDDATFSVEGFELPLATLFPQ
jgi:Uma2 family endonuclease